MEGLTVLQFLVGLGVLAGFIAVVVGIYAWGIRWLWRERGKGFAEGWLEVTERRQMSQARRADAAVPAPGSGERGTLPQVSADKPKSPAPASEEHPQYTITGRRIK
jgi:hypothetical protein